MDVVLSLLKSLHGLKQAAFEHWRASLNATQAIQLTQSKANPCVHHKWTNKGLMTCGNWVDDLLSCGDKEDAFT